MAILLGEFNRRCPRNFRSFLWRGNLLYIVPFAIVAYQHKTQIGGWRSFPSAMLQFTEWKMENKAFVTKDIIVLYHYNTRDNLGCIHCQIHGFYFVDFIHRTKDHSQNTHNANKLSLLFTKREDLVQVVESRSWRGFITFQISDLPDIQDKCFITRLGNKLY